VIVRAATAGDLPSVAGLRWRWSVEENGATPSMTRDAYAAAVAAWSAAHDDTHVGFVAERDGVLVGMTWLAISARFPTPQSADRRTADLQSVYVVPEARGIGAGSALLRAALGEAERRGAGRVVVHSSDSAIPVYEHLGFAPSPRLMDRETP